jgi:uncharacterized protein (DUF1501 family)
MDNCCNDFTRTQFLARAAAQAGQGLPAIEQGMPDPAGTGLNRRSFLFKSLGTVLAVYGVSKLDLPFFEEGIANAATGKDKVVLSVFMEGGADVLSMLAPDGDPLYKKMRPHLWLPPGQTLDFSEDDRLRWHPSLKSLQVLHQEGKVSVMPAIGYTDANQSHFTSRHYYEVGATDSGLQTGWLGRYLDRVGTLDNPIQGLSLSGSLQPSLASKRVPVAAVDGVDGYTFWGPGVWGDIQDEMLNHMKNFASASYQDPALAHAAAITAQAGTLREQLTPFVPKDDKTPAYTSPVTYPKTNEDFPKQLAGLAAALAAGLPIKAATVSAPGHYDTHSDQAPELSKSLKLTADTLLAFQRDLESRGLQDRVIIHVWSEFGRRASENGSGTDHGAAGVGFLIGSQVNGKMIGEFPGLSTGLDKDGNLKATSDFRGVYAAILEQWLGMDAGAIIPNASRFDRPQLIKGA